MLKRAGKNVVLNNISCQIPEDRSALTVLHNPIKNGDILANDGYIYNNGQRQRKWFGIIPNCDGERRIWEPKYNDLALLEARRWKAIEYRKLWLEEFWEPAQNALAAAGQAHARITHEHTGRRHWWLYTCSKDSPYGYSVYFHWVDKPRKPLNIEIGNRYYYVSFHMGRWMANRKQIFESAFNNAIDKYLRREENKPTKQGQTIRLVINKRNYWYTAGSNRYGVLEWKNMSRPEYELPEVVIIRKER